MLPPFDSSAKSRARLPGHQTFTHQMQGIRASSMGQFFSLGVRWLAIFLVIGWGDVKVFSFVRLLAMIKDPNVKINELDIFSL
jgi:hypothetical protein